VAIRKDDLEKCPGVPRRGSISLRDTRIARSAGKGKSDHPERPEPRGVQLVGHLAGGLVRAGRSDLRGLRAGSAICPPSPRSAPSNTARNVLDDAHSPVGVKAGIKIGTRIPGVFEVGVIQGRTERLFAAVHHNTPRGVRVRLVGTAYDEWIVGCADPEAVAAGLGLPAGA
jgi:hypothetical protein